MLTVLIADDDQIVLKILTKALESRGYQTITSSDGTSAWNQLIGTQPIDIAILDWFMPGLQGPELTERYAKLENARFIYNIILSGQLQKNNIIEALHRGAHEVMEKPIDLKLIESRLEVAGKIVREKRAWEEMAKTMQKYGEQMEELANERARQLIHAERMSGLGIMAAGIAHEINNPMSFISGNAQSLARFWRDLSPLLSNLQGEDTSERVKFILNEIPNTLESMMKGVDRVTKIVKSLKKYSGKQTTDHKEKVDLNAAIISALELCKNNFSKDLDLELVLASQPAFILGNSVEVEQVLINLLVNASQAMAETCNPKLKICTSSKDSMAFIDIIDNGCGIPTKIINKIWDPFVTTKPVGQGTGLGLSISSGIIKNHGGCIAVNNLTTGGAHFQISLPAILERQAE